MSFASWLLPSSSRPRRTRTRRTSRTTAGKTRLGVERLEERLVLSTYNPPTTGLVAWWAADGNANDAVGGHNGTLVNGTYGPGILGGTDQAFRLDGVSSSVQVPDDPAWNLGAGDFTIDLWVNYSALRGDSLGLPQSVFIGHDEGGGNTNKWFFAYGGGDLYFHMNSPAIGPNFLALAPFSPNLNQWYNLAITRAAGTFTIYVNGTAVASQNSPLAVPDASAPLTIGEAESPPGNFIMNGSMDDVLLYNRALSPQEVAGLTNAQSTTTVTSSAAPSVVGQSVTFTATVTSSLATPAGSVRFLDTTTGTQLGTAPLSSGGQATLTVPNLAAGSHVIQAVYAGEGLVLGSSGTVTQEVDYHFSGFLPPLDVTKVLTPGQTVPIRFRLTDFNGKSLSSLGDVKSLTANGVTLYDGTTGVSQQSANGRGLSYDAHEREFAFDWQTKGLAAGSYTLTLTLADGTSHAVTLQVKDQGGQGGKHGGKKKGGDDFPFPPLPGDGHGGKHGKHGHHHG